MKHQPMRGTHNRQGVVRCKQHSSKLDVLLECVAVLGAAEKRITAGVCPMRQSPQLRGLCNSHQLVHNHNLTQALSRSPSLSLSTYEGSVASYHYLLFACRVPLVLSVCVCKPLVCGGSAGRRVWCVCSLDEGELIFVIYTCLITLIILNNVGYEV